MAAVTSPIMTDNTGQSIARSLQTMAAGMTAPEITVSQQGTTTTVTATDSVTGTTTADIITPTATVTKSGSTATVSVTDANGTTSTTISDGGIDDSVLTNVYSESATYAVGDLCMHEHRLYRCTSAVNPYTEAHIVGSTAYANDWLSLEEGGTAISQASGTADSTVYKIVTEGNYAGKYYKWNETSGIYAEYTLNEPWDANKWTEVQLGNYALKSGAAVVITEDDSTPPSDTTCLWVFPES